MLWVLKRTVGAQWLSGRVLDWTQRGPGFEPHRRHCIVVLEQDTFILAKCWFNPGRPVPVTERLLMGVKDQIKQKNCLNEMVLLSTKTHIKVDGKYSQFYDQEMIS